jgi:hypothetical protein
MGDFSSRCFVTHGVKIPGKGIEPLIGDGLADIAHQGLIIIQVMDGIQPGTQDLVAA